MFELHTILAKKKFVLGNQLKKDGKLLEAVSLYKEAIELDSSQFSFYRSLAEIYTEQYKVNDAIAIYKQAIGLPNPPIWVAKGLVDTLAKKGQLAETLRVYRETLALQSVQALTSKAASIFHSGMGDSIIHLSTRQGQWDEACAFFTEACDNHPTQPWSFYYLGQATERQGLLDRALAYYEKAIQLDPGCYQANFRLSDWFSKQGDLSQAIQYAEKCLTIKPNAPKAHYQYVRILERMVSSGVKFHQIEQNLKRYQTIINNQLTLSTTHYFNLGKIFYLLQKFDDAISCNQEGINHLLNEKEKKVKFLDESWKTSKMCGPNFLIIGVAKCGTSSLYDYMIQHPNILPAITKEIRTYGLAQPREKFHNNLEYYKSLFPPKLPKYCTGEASPLYIHYSGVEQNVHEYFPDIKLIVILRNPVKRFLSSYNFFLQFNIEKRSLKETINSEIEKAQFLINLDRVTNPHNSKWGQEHLLQGMYFYFLKKWMNLLPKENFLILDSEDLRRIPNQVMKQVFYFLKLPDYQHIQYTKKNQGTYSPRVSKQLLSRLQEFYRPHNQRLEEFLGRKFNWD